jgi:hypothetical protein
MESNLIDVEKNIYLETLRRRRIFKTYLASLNDIVSKMEDGDNKVSIGRIVNIITNFDRDSTKLKQAHLLPILTSSELKKSHLYDILKENIKNNVFIYIPICPIYVRIFYHIYNCLIEELGLEILEKIKLKPQNTVNNEVFKALYEYQRISKQNKLLKRWFLDDKLTINEKSELRIKSNISDDVNSLEMLKLICNSFEENVIFFFDDIELINEKYGQENGVEWGEKAQIVFLEALGSLHIELKNVTILIPCLKKLWNSLLKYSNNYLRNLLESKNIEFYDLEDLKKKMMKVMDFYWIQSNLRPPANPFFPLSDKMIESFFEHSKGNLKHFFSLLIKNIDDILSGDILPESLD